LKNFNVTSNPLRHFYVFMKHLTNPDKLSSHRFERLLMLGGRTEYDF